jgi:endoglucanase
MAECSGASSVYRHFDSLLEELNNRQSTFHARDWVQSNLAFKRHAALGAHSELLAPDNRPSSSQSHVAPSSPTESLAESGLQHPSLGWAGVEGATSQRLQHSKSNAWLGAFGDRGWRDAVPSNDGEQSSQMLANNSGSASSHESLQSLLNILDNDRPGSLRLTSSEPDGFVSGATITASVRDRDGVTTVSYQWKMRSNNGQWQEIADAFSNSLALGDEHVGARFRVVATYTDNAGRRAKLTKSFTVAADQSSESPPGSGQDPTVPPSDKAPPVSEPTAPPPPLPAPNSPGVISVTSSSGSGFIEGAIVSANVIDADGVGPVSYQWQRSTSNGVWQNIAGATGKNFTIGFGYGGSELRVRATYIDGDGNSEAPQATFFAIDVDRPGHLAVTSSTGFVVGSQVTAQVSDPDGVGAVTYQWSSKSTEGEFEDIPGATGSTYTLTNNDGGHQLRAAATYVDLQGHETTLTEIFSVATPAPPLPPPSEPPPQSPPPAPEPMPPGPQGGDLMLGVNLAGAEFGSKPGTFGIDYIYPNHGEIDYYASKGVEIIRLPFLWERVQPTKNGPLSTAELARIDDVVDYAASKGLMVVLDVHNYGMGFGALIGSAQTPNSSFADFWGKLASHFVNDTNVIFGLMNEPHQQSATEWLASANAAIAAIRAAGATQLILVPGTYWDGAWTWVSSDNDTVIGQGVKDPLNNYAFEVHQYLDSDGSGTSPSVVSADIGVQRLSAVTEWAKATDNMLFLGEFGVAANPTSLEALDNMVNYLHQHQDVWLGATYWAGGPWWGNYMFSIEVANGVDKPQMDVLERYL